MTDDELDGRVMLQTGRHDLVTRYDRPIRFDAFIGEAALHVQVGTPPIMVRQLQSLVKLAEQPNITIRLVPLRGSWHPGLAGPFVLYQFDGSDPVLHFEHHSSGAFVHDEHDIEEYRRTIGWLDRIAYSEDESSAQIYAAAIKMNTLGENWND